MMDSVAGMRYAAADDRRPDGFIRAVSPPSAPFDVRLVPGVEGDVLDVLLNIPDPAAVVSVSGSYVSLGLSGSPGVVAAPVPASAYLDPETVPYEGHWYVVAGAVSGARDLDLVVEYPEEGYEGTAKAYLSWGAPQSSPNEGTTRTVLRIARVNPNAAEALCEQYLWGTVVLGSSSGGSSDHELTLRAPDTSGTSASGLPASNVKFFVQGMQGPSSSVTLDPATKPTVEIGVYYI